MSLTGNVGRVCKVDKDNCLLNQRVAKIEINKKYYKNFIFHVLQTYRFKEYMKMYAQGAAQDNLSVKDIYKYGIYLPTDKNIQKNISDVLDSFIDVLVYNKKKLKKLKQQQKSLMQLLLTGIVRV
jgi:type I restriction enzyme S subunit